MANPQADSDSVAKAAALVGAAAPKAAAPEAADAADAVTVTVFRATNDGISGSRGSKDAAGSLSRVEEDDSKDDYGGVVRLGAASVALRASATAPVRSDTVAAPEAAPKAAAPEAAPEAAAPGPVAKEEAAPRAAAAAATAKAAAPAGEMSVPSPMVAETSGAAPKVQAIGKFKATYYLPPKPPPAAAPQGEKAEEASITAESEAKPTTSSDGGSASVSPQPDCMFSNRYTHAAKE